MHISHFIINLLTIATAYVEIVLLNLIHKINRSGKTPSSHCLMQLFDKLYV